MEPHAPSAESTKVRFHSLDALRGWAMSMGIVLHGAWIMMSSESGAPKADASGTWLADYTAVAIHMFRMQLFFVLAGLFACLLVAKRGAWRFVLNRILRIALPMVLAWCVLSPLMMYQYNVGGIKSGAIQGNLSAWELTRMFFLNLSYQNVMQLHLWFIYHLCWIYGIVLILRAAVRLVDRQAWIRQRAVAGFGHLAESPWCTVVLAAAFVPPLFAMQGVWGVEVEYASLILKWPGVLTYLMFFMAGWLMYHNLHRLNAMAKHWRWQLAVGGLLTIPFFFYVRFAERNGLAEFDYPRLSMGSMVFDHERDLQKYPEFRAALLERQPGSIQQAVWDLIPAAHQEFVQAHPLATHNQIAGLLLAINLSVLGDPKFSENLDLAKISMSPSVADLAKIAPAQRTKVQNERVHREIVEAGFPGIIYGNALNRPYYKLIRVGYCFYYSLVTWLLIFGFVGLFQAYCHGESRFWRYFSDASYWMYLAHLPVQFQILLWFGEEPWHWTLKFLLYVLGTLAVLVPSYHFLVRPTWIGWLLNGKMVPLWKRSVRNADRGSESIGSRAIG